MQVAISDLLLGHEKIIKAQTFEIFKCVLYSIVCLFIRSVFVLIREIWNAEKRERWVEAWFEFM